MRHVILVDWPNEEARCSCDGWVDNHRGPSTGEQFAAHVEAEAALLARPVEPEPDELEQLREALRDANAIVTMTREHLAADHPDCAYTALGVMNDESRRLLARRAPGDRALRELLEEGLADGGGGGSLNLDHRWWREKARRALAADSRPEQPGPDAVDTLAAERHAIAKEVTRDGGRRRVWTNSGDKGASVEDAHAVRPEEPPE